MVESNNISLPLFVAPTLDDHEGEVLNVIAQLREKLYWQLREPRRWTGSLRRAQFARAVQGSNSIEGYNAPRDDVAAINLGEAPLDAAHETMLAVKGYRDAMTYVLQLANDDRFAFSEQLLKSLHFMMTSYDLSSRPGRWRAGAIYVRNDQRDEVVYEGPDVDQLDALMGQLIAVLEEPRNEPALIRGAMAHLNLVMIHPFRDGNGRMARCLQTLVLAREHILSAVFSSVEEYLGQNTPAYYEVLKEVGHGSWHPERDARPWIRFMLTAHLVQAKTLVRRVRESELLWENIEFAVRQRKLNERVVAVLWDAAMGYRVRNATYRAIFEESADDPISEAVATKDLKQLVEVGLLVSQGERRGRIYLAGEELREMRRSIVRARNPLDLANPFAHDRS